MKSKLLKTSVGTIIFLLLIAAVFAVLQPVYKKVSAFLHEKEDYALAVLEDKTGLGLSYKSLSPSILSGINIKSIVIYDVSDKKSNKSNDSRSNILTVKKAVLKYNLWKIISGDFENAFTGLYITGVESNLNISGNTEFARKIMLLSNKGSRSKSNSQNDNKVYNNNNSENEDFLTDDITNSIRKYLFALPFTVEIKKVSVSYTDSSATYSVGINRLQLSKVDDGSYLSGFFDGHAIMGFSDGKTAGVSLSAKGRLVREMTGSSALCAISPYSKADYTLGTYEFMFRYNDSQLVLRSIQNLQPLTIYGSLNKDTGDVIADIKMDSLNPFSIVKMNSISSQLEPLVGSTISAELQLSYNIPQSLLSWQTQGLVDLSKKISSDGEKISFSLSGDNENIDIYSLNAEGSLADIGFSGSYCIPTMQPTGTLSVAKYILPNGSKIAGDLYFDATDSGFMCFIPQLFLGNETLTALQLDVAPQYEDEKLDSFDMSFQMSDYSHSEYESPGEIKIDASYTIGKNQYVQASASISNFFLDTVAKVASVFADEKSQHAISQMAPQLAPYIFTNEIYVSSDLKSFSFNSPYFILVNSKQEKQALILSFDGSNNAVSISQFELVYGENHVVASLNADISAEDQEVFFTSSCVVNSIPYNFSGNYNKKWLGISGDYGLEASVSLSQNMSGSVSFTSLPVSINGYILSLSTSVLLSSSKFYGMSVDISSLEVEELSGKIPIKPKVMLTGRVDSQGFVISSLSYTDTTSSLDGSGQILWNINNEILDSVTAEVDLKNELSPEQVSLSANFTNPLHAELSQEHLMNDCYFTLQSDIKSFQVSRFISGQIQDDTLSGQISASGTFNNPFISVNLSGFSIQFNGAPLVAKGNIVMEDGNVEITSMDMEWSGMKISNTKGGISLSSYEGKVDSEFNLDFAGKTMYTPFTIKMENLSKKKSVFPESFVVSLESENITGTLLNKPLPIQVYMVRTPGRMDITSGDVLGVSGYVLDDGTMKVAVKKDKPLNFVLDGKTDAQFIDLNFNQINCDVKKISYLINSPYFSLYNGIVSGTIKISGLGTDPDINGSLSIDGLEFNLPDYVPEHITTDQLLFTCSQDEINVQKTMFCIDERYFTVGANVVLDRWTFDSMKANIVTEGAAGIPIDVNVPLFRLKGDTILDLTLGVTGTSFNIDGSIGLQNSEITAMTNLTSKSDSDSSESTSTSVPMDMNVNVRLLVGQKVQIILNPILRGLIAPQTPIDFTMDSVAGTWNLKGDIVLRGGEVTYLSRSFYLKEGRIVLNETQNSFDPNLTIRAETRERDENDEPVTITLSAIRQNVSNFNPQLTSSPAKSENEIMSLLGQIVTADSSSEGKIDFGNLLAAGLDFGVQVTVLRKAEDTLRDFFNFDIFSMRTMLLQNALKQSLNTDQNTEYTFGNYFDNSTVYIGKYFGSNLYADAMLQWSYDSSKYKKDDPVSGIVFQPELGFELSAPFANIRWSYAPDLGSLLDSFVSATSITLSWKYSF